MRRAFAAVRLELSAYARSGRIVVPLLFLLAFPLIINQVKPVEAVSGFSMSCAGSFAFGLWTACSFFGAEPPALRRILQVKCSMNRLEAAQLSGLACLGALAGAWMIAATMFMRLCMPDFFLREPHWTEVLWGLAANVAFGICGALTGALTAPQLIRDRKLARLGAIAVYLIGLIGGTANLPPALRLLFPPLYDALSGMGAGETLTAATVLPAIARALAYAAACVLLRWAVRARRGE